MSTCFDLLDNILDQSYGKGSKYKVSQYDARRSELHGSPRTYPPGHKDVEAYLGGSGASSLAANFKQVLKAIHSYPSYEAGQEYEECTDPPYIAL